MVEEGWYDGKELLSCGRGDLRRYQDWVSDVKGRREHRLYEFLSTETSLYTGKTRREKVL